MNFSRIFSACIAAVAFAASAGAQGNGSDMSGVGGAGGGMAGSLGVGVPSTGSIGGAATTPTGFGGGVSNQAAAFASAPSGGTAVKNPVTGTSLNVSQGVSQALGAALRGNATGAGPLSAALTANGAMNAATATGLVQALTALGGSPTLANLQAAVRAYNAAISGSTGPVNGALLSVRQALAGIGGR